MVVRRHAGATPWLSPEQSHNAADRSQAAGAEAPAGGLAARVGTPCSGVRAQSAIYTANDQPIAETAVPDEPELEDMARKLLGAFCDQARGGKPNS
jgi:hypothetical protein